MFSQLAAAISTLRHQRTLLTNQFLNGGTSCFLQEHTAALDDYFCTCLSVSPVKARIREGKDGWSIIALGGYGRRQQFLNSDIDILLLFNEDIPAQAQTIVQQMLYPLWDSGFEVGYTIRTAKECLKLARQDFKALTSLLDARLVCGSCPTYTDLTDKLYSKLIPSCTRRYIKWLSERNRNRHKRFGDSTYLLEPNLKNGLGGLRDYHAMLWAGRILFGITCPQDLARHGYVPEDEFQSLTDAVSFIELVRNWLHHLTKRKCDQLYLEHQATLADKLGFVEQAGQRGVERFLGALHCQMEFVKREHLSFLDRAVAALKKTGKLKVAPRAITAGIEIIDGCLTFQSEQAILDNPDLLVEIFKRSASMGRPLSIGAARLIRKLAFLAAKAKFLTSRKVLRAINRILASPRALTVLNEMLNTGFLVVLIPEFAGIVNRIQYDDYHLYPVDKHCLWTVQSLNLLRDTKGDARGTFYCRLFKELVDPAPLLWAALLHDIGKSGQGKSHAARGEVAAKTALQRMAFSEAAIETVAFLVREHLLLAETAARKDINDEKVIFQCAGKIKDMDHLRMLYLLTIADAKATGSKAWNDWIEALLKELFVKLCHVVEKEEMAKPSVSDVIERKRIKVLQLGQRHEVLAKDRLEVILDHMPSRYLFRVPLKSILSHIGLFKKLSASSILTPLAFDWQVHHFGADYRTVTICSKDFPGLFARIAGVFALHNLVVLSAQIYTWGNHVALDIFQIKAPLDPLHENEKWTRVERDLMRALENASFLETDLRRSRPPMRRRQKAMQRTPGHVSVDNKTSDFFTIIEVYTHDSPGLLYWITSTLFNLDLDICLAKLATLVDQTVNVFYVRSIDGQKIDDIKRADMIQAVLEELLSNINDDSRQEVTRADVTDTVNVS